MFWRVRMARTVHSNLSHGDHTTRGKAGPKMSTDGAVVHWKRIGFEGCGEGKDPGSTVQVT